MAKEVAKEVVKAKIVIQNRNGTRADLTTSQLFIFHSSF